MANGDGGGTTARGRSPRPIPLSEHKISGHKSSTIRPPLVALVPVLHRGWYLVHEIDHVGETEVGRQRSVPRSEDGTGRMERAVLPPRPCRLLDALDPYLIFLCWPTERNFPFLLSPPPAPLPGSGSCQCQCEKQAISAERRCLWSERCVRPRRIAITRDSVHPSSSSITYNASSDTGKKRER